MSNFYCSATVSAPSICLGHGENAFDGFSIEIELEEDCATVYAQDYWANQSAADSLAYLVEGLRGLWDLLPQGRSGKELPIEPKGDIAAPEAKVWNYSKDVMSLARSAKREEVRNSKELLFGVELEFNHSSHTLQDLYPLLGMGIFKHDGSVDGEFVTLPYTYEEMVSKITEVASSFDKLLSANDTLHPRSEVGMHIHLSRKGLTGEQVDFLRSLFDGSVAPYISYLCQRYPNHFCSYHPYCGDRYVAFNEANRNTVEIRAFLSPKDAEGILRNLALVKAWLDEPEMWVDMNPEYDVPVEDLEAWWDGLLQPTQTPTAAGDYEGDATAGWEVFADEEGCEASLGGCPKGMFERTLYDLSDGELEQYIQMVEGMIERFHSASLPCAELQTTHNEALRLQQNRWYHRMTNLELEDMMDDYRRRVRKELMTVEQAEEEYAIISQIIFDRSVHRLHEPLGI
jgi:hypothetical protein